MIQVESKQLRPEDCKILARITSSAREKTPLESGKSIEEIAVDIEKISSSHEDQLLVARDDKGVILGWISFYVGIPPMAFIDGFMPIVDSRYEPEKTALSLIEAAKRNIVGRGYTRIEIEMKLQTDGHRALSKGFVDWYEKCDFQFAAEEAHMRSNLTSLSLPSLRPPRNCILRRLSEVSYEQLETAGFQAFENSKDDLFHSESHAEQKVELKYFFDVSRPFIENASFILERDGKIVGFVITRMRDNEAEIGPIGFIPEARGQGLASYLLASALRNLRSNGLISATLDVSIANLPAKKLYRKYGFDEMYYQQFYFWSPDISK
jgi:ribosomal protein S18 acetylase RimI-like enzyme